MEFITDRRSSDLYARNEKGVYTGADLDRVEQAVAELSQWLRTQGVDLNLQIYTQWQKSRRIPTRQEMDRYLGNVYAIVQAMNIPSSLPGNMEYLDFEGANLIELVLEKAYKIMEKTKGVQDCGVC